MVIKITIAKNESVFCIFCEKKLCATIIFRPKRSIRSVQTGKCCLGYGANIFCMRGNILEYKCERFAERLSTARVCYAGPFSSVRHHEY